MEGEGSMTTTRSTVDGSAGILSLEGTWETATINIACVRGQGRITEMASQYQAAIAAAERLGTDDLGIASNLNQLAKLYREWGEDGQAELLLERALGIEEKALGPAHPQVAITLTDLMFLYRRQGRERAAAAAAARATHILATHARESYAV
jgi:hypothetical protein